MGIEDASHSFEPLREQQPVLEISTEDRIERSQQKIHELEGTAWIHSVGDATGDLREGWKNEQLVDGSMYQYDPQRIEIISSSIPKHCVTDAMVNAYAQQAVAQGRDWQYLGQRDATSQFTASQLLFARPFLLELPIPVVPNAKIEVALYEDYGQEALIIRINDLAVMITAIPPTTPEEMGSELHAAFSPCEGTVNVTINRAPLAESSVPLRYTGRNPEHARSSLRTEMRIALQQLKIMGYTKIASLPSDSRRARVYKRIGMKPIGATGWLVANIDDLANGG
jgi:hypothetical protein